MVRGLILKVPQPWFMVFKPAGYIVQLNRLYNCPGSGVQGRLQIYLGQAENLGTSSNVSVEVRAVKDSRMGEVRSTRSIVATHNPHWQYIDISIVDDTGVQLTRRQSFSVNPGNHSYRHTFNCRTLNFSINLEYECPSTQI